MDKPLLVFDGDCGFCRRWVLRWKHVAGEKIEFQPFQELQGHAQSAEFPKAVHLLEPDGTVSRGAEAIFRMLKIAGHPGWLWMYRRFPGFSTVTKFLYDLVAGHRLQWSTVTRWVWDAPSVPSSYVHIRWIFLRVMALLYAIAFWSYGIQIRALNGAQGILPAREFLEHVSHYGAVKFWYVPSLAWLNSSDAFLVGMCVAGGIMSCVLFFNIAPRPSLALLWVLYLSIVSIGGDFMNFQWDALLLETGFLAVWFAPDGFLPQWRGSAPPSRPVLFLLRWLLFRLMFLSAIVKWFSGDLLWRRFTALTVHYQTQPLPNPLSWYVHQCPLWFQKMSCVGMFLIEGVVPFMIFAPRRYRFVAFFCLCFLQTLILLTGNYAYFNGLAIALCILLLDDSSLRRWVPSWWSDPVVERAPSGLRQAALVVVMMTLTILPMARSMEIPLPSWVWTPAKWASPLRSFNGYGLFAVMTPRRPEIIIEGSNDRKNWKEYSFKFKPGDLARRPRQVAPYQPRLDWQMWFAALGDYRQNTWFIRFCARILQGSKPVLALLGDNPFPNQPPLYLRAQVYEYRFSSIEERRRSGDWWERSYQGPYCPVLSLKRS